MPSPKPLMEGVVNTLNRTYGYCFIRPTDGSSSDIFCHATAFARDGYSFCKLNVGDTVKFRKEPIEDGRFAAKGASIVKSLFPRAGDEDEDDVRQPPINPEWDDDGFGPEEEESRLKSQPRGGIFLRNYRPRRTRMKSIQTSLFDQ